MHQAHGGVLAVRRCLARVEATMPRVVAVCRAVVYPIALLIVGYMAYRAVRDTDLSAIRYPPIGVALGFALVWWLALAAGWASLVDERAAVVTWCRTQVARYLPGSIWALATRASTVKGRIRHKVAAVVAENLIVLVVSLGVGGLFLGLTDVRWLPLVVLAIVPLVSAGRLARSTNLTAAAIRRTTLIYAAGFLAYGVFSVLVQRAISGGLDMHDELYVAGASCFAWAAGLVVVFAPGGVGVRELAYVWLLSALLPHAQLQAGAVASRMVTILAELLVLMVLSRRALAWRSGPRTVRAEPGREPERGTP